MADIKSEKIRNIIERSAVELVQLVGDIEEQVERALIEIDEGEKLTISHSIVIDIEADKLTNKVSCNLKTTGTSECQLPSGQQPGLPGIVDPVAEAARKLGDMFKDSGGKIDAVKINFPGAGEGFKIDGTGVHKVKK